MFMISESWRPGIPYSVNRQNNVMQAGHGKNFDQTLMKFSNFIQSLSSKLCNKMSFFFSIFSVSALQSVVLEKHFL